MFTYTHNAPYLFSACLKFHCIVISKRAFHVDYARFTKQIARVVAAVASVVVVHCAHSVISVHESFNISADSLHIKEPARRSSTKRP